MDILDQLSETLQKGDAEGVKKLTAEALDAGLSPDQIQSEGLIAGMNIVGAKFKNNELFIPEVLVVAKAMHAALDILKPRLAETGAKPLAKVVLGTVKADLHDIGKNMVGMMLKGAGFDVNDIGIDCPPEKFVEAASDEGVKIVAMSALLSTTMPNIRVTIQALHEAGLTGKVKTLVGGAPVTKEYAAEIGADGYGENSAEAVDVARELLGIQIGREETMKI
jgi:5-methyltetrahydrofolate--homocysteine methyltransferase